MDENDPVAKSEFVYRRILRRFCDPSLAIPLQLQAFRPTENDITGLSVLRATFAQPADTFLNLGADRANDYFVARLSVLDLQKLGLSVVPEPIAGGPPGHAIIPELTWKGYQSQKQKWKEVLLEVARLASADIVFRPS